jgi:hypothetical protein
MGWNGHSWLLSSHLLTETILSIASVLYIVATLGFAAGGVGYILDQDWAVTVLIATAVLSTVVLVVMWDGETGSVGRERDTGRTHQSRYRVLARPTVTADLPPTIPTEGRTRRFELYGLRVLVSTTAILGTVFSEINGFGRISPFGSGPHKPV